MYYNVKAMADAMGLSNDDVIAKIDNVKTWDDYEALGTEYVEAAGQKGTKYWTSVDTGGTDWLWLAMAEYGEDWTGGFKNKANVQLDSVKNMLKMQQKWLKNQQRFHRMDMWILRLVTRISLIITLFHSLRQCGL